MCVKQCIGTSRLYDLNRGLVWTGDSDWQREWERSGQCQEAWVWYRWLQVRWRLLLNALFVCCDLQSDSSTAAQFFKEERTDDAVYNIYLKKVQYSAGVSCYLYIISGVGDESTLGDFWPCPNFSWHLPEKYVSYFFFGGGEARAACSLSPTPMYIISLYFTNKHGSNRQRNLHTWQ